MHGRSHAGQSCHGLTLTSGCDDNCVFFLIILQQFDIDQCSLRNTDISKLLCGTDDVYHAAAFHHNLTSVLAGSVDHLLYTVYVGCECRDDDTVLSVLCKDRIKCLSNCLLRHGKTFTCGIRRIAHQCQNAFLSKLCQPLQIRYVSEYRSIVNLKIAGVQDHAGRCEYCKSSRICDTVIHLNELHTETSKINGLSVFYHFTLHIFKHIILF